MDNLGKIYLKVENGLVRGESVWAERLGEHTYRLQNIPYHATGYSEGDVVRCELDDGSEVVVGLMDDSGNGTIRLMFTDAESPEAQEVLGELASVGCTYEIASSKLVALTVPPTLEIPFSQLANYLNDLPEDILAGWEVGKRFTRVHPKDNQ